MIDTIKIYTEIDKNTHDYIKSMSQIKTAFDNYTKEQFYEVINDHLKGSFDSSLSVRVGCGAKYKFVNLGYFIEIEGSYHKIIYGYNSHNGYTDLQFISTNLIQMVELYYNIKLPDISSWFLQRCDIAICFDLSNQDNVKNYINSLSRCKYPRRNAKFFYDESIYLSGTTTTLKIYNKLLEFRKHDLKKFTNSDFNVFDYCKKIDGFIRFECEIKKKLLVKFFKQDYINILSVKYEDLKKIWSDEFMKLLQFIKNDLEVVKSREDVYNRLHSIYKNTKANRLFNFYCSIQLNGLADVKLFTSSTSYYRNIQDLKSARVDFSQSYKVIEDNSLIDFNPFEWEEVV